MGRTSSFMSLNAQTSYVQPSKVPCSSAVVHQHSPRRMRGLGVMKVTRVVGGRWFVVLNPHCGVQQGGFNMFL